jgi:DNA invertase Pin-like site-specific DNA recombinase
MVAQLLMREGEPVTGPELESALATLEQHSVEQRQRRIRSEISEAERKGDLAGVTVLITERMELDRRLRDLDRRLRELLGQA